jgi:hypothetical protein
MDLCNASRQSFPSGRIALVFCVQESRDKYFGKFRSNDAAAKAEHIHIVVQYALRGRIRVVTNGRVYTSHLVRGDTCADARSAAQDAAFGIPVLNGASNLLGKIRVVHRVGAVRANIDWLMSSIADGVQDYLFERETRMVKSYDNFHNSPKDLSGLFHKSSFALATTFSTVNPKCSKMSL